MHKVLILDGNQRSALAATRSLGQKGIPVVVADDTDTTLAGSSRYCKETFLYPSSATRSEEFLIKVRNECLRRKIDIVFPMTDVSTALMAKHRDALAGITIPLPSFDAFDNVTDKWKLFKLAQKLDIPIPRTYYMQSGDDLSSVAQNLTFPIVLKPYQSRIFVADRWISTSVQYAASYEELLKKLSQNKCFSKYHFLLQEYVRGTGQGLFALYDRGRPVTFFEHRRLREKPPSGGVSVLSESIPLDPALCQYAQRILETVHWHGVAMVEFKVSPEGDPYLMEVNGRFWGSLQLAIDAGVNFPWLLYQLATGKGPDRISPYRVGTKCRWLLGDLDHLYLSVCKNKSGSPHSMALAIKSLWHFLNFFGQDTRYETNRWDDLKPFIFELNKYFFNR